ncbi:MAG TPA: chemotaxis protein CheD [Aquabacterium sp.]|nr:chemotaxis protein CheD [Aquabacterium sp.]
MTAAVVPLTGERVILPGQIWFGGGAQQASTLLGSCVAFTLWHPVLRLGGMCHYMLPERPPSLGGGLLDGRYGDEALALLLRAARAAGCPPEECETKLFGGGCMFEAESLARGDALQVNLRNVEQAHRLALRHGLRVVAHHLGGEGHRQIRLHLDTGDVWMRFSPRQSPMRRWA